MHVKIRRAKKHEIDQEKQSEKKIKIKLAIAQEAGEELEKAEEQISKENDLQETEKILRELAGEGSKNI